jgi:hypothetical protein
MPEGGKGCGVDIRMGLVNMGKGMSEVRGEEKENPTRLS